MTARKNPNGAGSVRKRADGRWEGRYTAPDGRQKSVYARTKTDCQQALKLRLAQITTGAYFEPSRLTLGEWLETWLNDYCGHIKPTTRQTYRMFLWTHIVPAIGAVKLGQLSAVHVQRAFNAMDISPSSQRSVRIALSSALSAAVRFGLIGSNPCEHLTLGKPSRRQMVIVDRDRFAAFVAAAKDTPVAAALILLLQTGIRSGELRGLRWSDVDLDAATLTVSRQMTFTRDLGHHIATPKSGASRTVALMPETVALLREHRRAQMEARLAGGWVDTDLTRDLVFRFNDGQFYGREILGRYAAKVGAAIGLPDLHPHDLRHSYAVAALRSGVDVKTVQNNLGHASAAMTLDTYAAYTSDMGRAAASKMSAFWAENTPG